MSFHSWPDLPGFNARVHLLNGILEVDSICSALRIRTCHYSQRKSLDADDAKTILYLLGGREVGYIGHRCVERRYGEALAKPIREQFEQLYVVECNHPHFIKSHALYLEDRLVEIAKANGIPLANQVPPAGRTGAGARVPEWERLLHELLVMLPFAQCRIFSEPRTSKNVHTDALAHVTHRLNDIKIIHPEDFLPPSGAQLAHLNHRGVQATGYKVGKRLWVCPGSDFRTVDKPGLDVNTRTRRSNLLKKDIFQPGQTRPDIRSLRVGLDCSSQAIAAKAVTGQHIGSKFWDDDAQPGTV